ncbi:MAG: Fur family transcriptional regulator [Cyanobacteria bacterium MAG CAR3_bin_5]|nr:Fur family transcriptional regulator [Cyanobacteria bacterium MAG CAR4_bin_6]MCY4173435.1 Fur family transcriptional regulator [Cyanobacteria bacterium MAG CAR3_bin_5]MCY4235620.1 Fur family transcriptional regulator [Cyanobacteria bacterium MAG CAR2_bin_4]MCY4331790.1 Fur family transcriptional regulator [Cyanobacteria bacterium MAG CAR1_bin_15]
MVKRVPAAAIQQYSQEHLREVLNTAGRRLTPQREKVLSLFQSLGPGHHLTADDVHHHLKQSGNKVSLATVYRSLKLLVTMRLLDEGEWQEGLRCYELRQGGSKAHHHMVCMRCGCTEEFFSEVITAASRDVAQVTGFELTEVRLILRGVCRRCRQRSKATAETLNNPNYG